MHKFKGCHIWYLILSLLLFVSSILLFPNFTGLKWGEKLIDILLSICLLFYFIFIIIPELETFSKKHLEAKIITLIETIFIAFLMVSNTLSSFGIMDGLSNNLVIGIVLYLRGTSLIVLSIYGKQTKLKFLAKYLYILLISFSVWMMFANEIIDKYLLIGLCLLFSFLALISFIYSLIYWPKKNKIFKKKNNDTSLDVIEEIIVLEEK